MSKPFVRSVLGLLATAAFAAPALAADVFAVQANVEDFQTGCGAFTGSGNSSHPVTAGFACPRGEAGAVATPGHVGVAGNVTGLATISATARYDTAVTFMPTGSEDATEIPIQLNLAFGGSMAITDPGQARYSAIVDIEHVDFARSTDLTTGLPITHGALSLGFSSGGEVDNPDIVLVGGVLTTAPVMVGVGAPVNISIFLSMFGQGPGGMDALFEHSLDFVRGQDVFTLPAGFTAEDPDAFIVDNRFTPPGAVPEPASWALMIAGFGLAGAMLRHRKAQAA